MKHVWKALGVAALLAGLSPYRVTTDTATGDKKIRALLWKATYGGDPENRGLSLNFGFFPPNEEEEAHLFADELVVHYHSDRPRCGDEEPCCGDSASYPDSFCDALAEIRDGLEATGCTFVGALDAAEYDGCTSRICRDGKVIGLAVDDGASEAVNDARMEKWIAAVGF